MMFGWSGLNRMIFYDVEWRGEELDVCLLQPKLIPSMLNDISTWSPRSSPKLFGAVQKWSISGRKISESTAAFGQGRHAVLHILKRLLIDLTVTAAECPRSKNFNWWFWGKNIMAAMMSDEGAGLGGHSTKVILIQLIQPVVDHILGYLASWMSLQDATNIYRIYRSSRWTYVPFHDMAMASFWKSLKKMIKSTEMPWI